MPLCCLLDISKLGDTHCFPLISLTTLQCYSVYIFRGTSVAHGFTLLWMFEMEVWPHGKNPKQKGGPFQHTAMLKGQKQSFIPSIFISILTTRTAPTAQVRREMIESPGISVKNRKRSSHRTAGQYQNRQLLLFTHDFP